MRDLRAWKKIENLAFPPISKSRHSWKIEPGNSNPKNVTIRKATPQKEPSVKVTMLPDYLLEEEVSAARTAGRLFVSPRAEEEDDVEDEDLEEEDDDEDEDDDDDEEDEDDEDFDDDWEEVDDEDDEDEEEDEEDDDDDWDDDDEDEDEEKEEVP